MRRLRFSSPSRCLCLAVGVVALAVPGRAAAIDWTLELSPRVFSQSLPRGVLDTQRVSTSTLSYTSFQLRALGSLALRPFDPLGLRVGFDSGLVDIRPEGATIEGSEVGTFAEKTWFLGETWGEYQFGEAGIVALQAGKLRPRIGGGAVFDAYALGVALDVDPGLDDRDIPWRFRAHALLPSGDFTKENKKSPLLNGEIGYAFDENSEVRLLGSVLFDREDGLVPIFAEAELRARARDLDRALRERPLLFERFPRLSETFATERFYNLHSSGAVGWIGLTGKTTQGALSLRSTLLLNIGTFVLEDKPARGLEQSIARLPELLRPIATDIFLTERATDARIFAAFFDASANLEIGSGVTMESFFVFASGESEFLRGGNERIGGFISLAPLLPYTSIFFAGGLSTNVSSPTVVSVGPDGSGLFAGGGAIAYVPSRFLQARVTSAVLSATEPSATTGGSFYGLETNLMFGFQVLEFLALTGEFGVFLPGSYYGDEANGFLGILGLDFEPI